MSDHDPLVPAAPPLTVLPETENPLVPVEGRPDYVWPSWREALVDAWQGVPNAYDRRKRVVQAAYDTGLSFRQIADAVGANPATVHKIIGRQRGRDDSALDEPAGITFTEKP